MGNIEVMTIYSHRSQTRHLLCLKNKKQKRKNGPTYRVNGFWSCFPLSTGIMELFLKQIKSLFKFNFTHLNIFCTSLRSYRHAWHYFLPHKTFFLLVKSLKTAFFSHVHGYLLAVVFFFVTLLHFLSHYHHLQMKGKARLIGRICSCETLFHCSATPATLPFYLNGGKLLHPFFCFKSRLCLFSVQLVYRVEPPPQYTWTLYWSCPTHIRGIVSVVFTGPLIHL